MKTSHVGIGLALLVAFVPSSFAGEARLVRYPHYHNGQVAFTYMGDIWTMDESSQHIHRLTAHRGRDMTPRFSPDGQWIAFSSDREGNLDVWVVPAIGGSPKQLTFHSSDDSVLGWSPDGKQVLFYSSRGDDFLGTLYVVPLDGGGETKAGTDFGMYGCFSPDGTKLAVNRKGQSYWRKGYRGSYQTDVTVVDLKEKTFKDVTNHNGMDTWPMWSSDGAIYFVSDRDEAAQPNLWKVPQDGGEAVRVTNFKDGDVRFPAMSGDGKTIVFERDYRLWKLDLGKGEPAAIPLVINAEPQDTLTEYRRISSEVDDYDVAPSGRAVIASVHGELFLVPTGEDGDLTQVTKGAARDRNVEFSPDGKLIALVSDQESAREEIYVVAADGSGEPQRITDIDALKTSYTWSPDSKQLAFTALDGKLYLVSADGGEAKELLASKYGTIGRPMFSPDGSLLAFSMPDVTRTDDVFILPVDGGEPKKVTFDSASDRSPAFSADGKKLYFIRSDSFGGEGSFGSIQSGLMVVLLERQDSDPSEATTADNSPEANQQAVDQRRAASEALRNPKPPTIDWAGLKRRTRSVLSGGGSRGRGTRSGGSSGGISVSSFTPGRDGRTIYFAGSSGGSLGVFSCTDDGRSVRQIASAATPTSTEDDDDGRRGRGGFGRGGISNLRLTRDGRIYYQQGNGVYSASAGSGGGPPTGGSTGGRGFGSRGGAPSGARSSGSSESSGGGSSRRVTFNVTLKIDKPEEWKQMFGDAWRTMKYRFYDPKLHGVDWDAARAKYEPIVEHVADRQELMNLINEMIGELNASHTGAAAGRSNGDEGSASSAVQTVHLGIDLVPDAESGRFQVAHVFEEGPADKDWIKISAGDYLLAIDGESIDSDDSLWRRLTNRRLNRKVKLTLNSKPEDEGSWTVRYEPISWGAYTTLRYERWVKQRRAKVEELSNSRIGYVHIKAMDQTSLRRFEKELRENRHKEALVIDQRFNGGGNIEQELLAILVQKPYQVWQPRGTEPTDRPLRGFFGPKIVLQNWRSASNAEMFPAGFRALGLGKLVGTPTMGAVIGTNSYSLIDGSTVRTPSVGVYLADSGRTNMENYGVQPDIHVENAPEDNLAGRDRQLEAAVAELLRGLPSTPAPPLAGAAAGSGEGQ